MGSFNLLNENFDDYDELITATYSKFVVFTFMKLHASVNYVTL